MKLSLAATAVALIPLLLGANAQNCFDNGTDVGPSGRIEILRGNGNLKLERKGGPACGCSFVSAF